MLGSIRLTTLSTTASLAITFWCKNRDWKLQLSHITEENGWHVVFNFAILKKSMHCMTPKPLKLAEEKVKQVGACTVHVCLPFHNPAQNKQVHLENPLVFTHPCHNFQFVFPKCLYPKIFAPSLPPPPSPSLPPLSLFHLFHLLLWVLNTAWNSATGY